MSNNSFYGPRYGYGGYGGNYTWQNNPNDIRSELFGMDLAELDNKSLKWISDNGYGANVSVYSIIKKIVTSSMAVKLVIKDQNDKIIESGELFDKLQEPGIYQGEQLDTDHWREYAITYLLTTGNLFQKPVNLLGGFGLDELEIIPSGIIKPIVSNTYFSNSIGFEVSDKQKTFKLDQDEVNHTKYINPTTYGLDSLFGLSPLQAGLFALTGSTDIQKALAVVVKNQGVRGILNNESNTNMDPTVMDRIKAAFTRMIGGIKNHGGIHVSNTKMAYVPMGMSPTDLKLIESGVLTDRQLCNMYGFSSRLLNDPNASTYNNILEDSKTLYTNAVIPVLKNVVSSFNNTISKKFNETSNSKQWVHLDTSHIEALQGDKKKKAEKDRIIALGIKDILSSNTSVEGKIEQLVYVYEMTEEQAKKIAGNGPETEA